MFQASKTCSNKNKVGRTKYRTAQIYADIRHFGKSLWLRTFINAA